MKKVFTLIGIVSLIFTQAQIVISEIYGGGGSPSLALSHDYIMLKNIGTETASLNGATYSMVLQKEIFHSIMCFPTLP